MIGDLFDSQWKILIVAIVIIVLFGSAKLPAAARSLGRSMRILKSEVSSMHDDEDKDGQSPVAAPASPVRRVSPAVRAHAAHSVINWTPSWRPGGTYEAAGLPFDAGYSGILPAR